MAIDLFTPYTSLLVQVIGVAAGAVAALHVLGHSTRRGSLAISGAPALGVMVLLGAIPALWYASGSNDESRKTYNTPGLTFEEKCLQDHNRPELAPYFRWVRTQIPDDAVYTGTTNTCFAFQLLPRRIARPGQAADWALHPDGLPPAVKRRARAERRLPPARRTVFALPDGRGVEYIGERAR